MGDFDDAFGSDDEPTPEPKPVYTDKGCWPQTQKARGVLFISRHSLCLGGWGPQKPRNVSIHPGKNHTSMLEVSFARPCPSTPRHGFLESRTLRGMTDALNMMGEVRDLDPNGEVIMMPLLSGEYSVVATNAGLVWGLGNDGATGEHETLTIPVPLPLGAWNKSIYRGRTLPGITNCGYLELVENKNQIVVVQLRDGPEQSINYGDFIPKDVVVKGVIRPVDVSFDLTKWETLVKGAKKKKGVVIVISTTPNRASHFAVHGLIANLPIVFSHDAEWLNKHKGDKLKATEEGVGAVEKMTQTDYEELAHEVMLKFTTKHEAKVETDIYRVETSIGVCHTMANWGADKHLLALRAEGIVSCFQFTARACLGELRHFYRRGPGRGGVEPEKLMQTDLGKFMSEFNAKGLVIGGGDYISREDIYDSVGNLTLADQISLMKTSRIDLAEPGWKQVAPGFKTDCGFGGVRWAQCATLAWRLGRALVAFCKKPDQERWEKAALLYNRTINVCHNGGKVLTKWCPPDVFDTGVNSPSLCLLNPVVAHTIFGSDTLRVSRTQTLRDFKRQVMEVK